jgi:NADH-quinone oxidoreductase subunit G
VNRFFMCDEGRLNYRWMNRPDRLHTPTVDGAAVEWEAAVEAAAKALRGRRAYVVANPSLSNETLFLLKRLIALSGGSGHFTVRHGDEAPLPGVPDLALRADRAANATGAEALGFRRESDAFSSLGSGDVLVLADTGVDGAPPSTLTKAAAVIVIGTVLPNGVRPTVILPIANVAEEEGTLTNLRRRVQRFLQARAAPGQARPSWYVLADLLGAMGEQADYLTAEAVFTALASSEPAFAGLSYGRLGLRGQPMAGGGA